MSAESYQFQLFWDDRPETPEQCAARLARTFDELHAQDEIFAEWTVITPESRSRVREQICRPPADPKQLATIFDNSRRHYDYPAGKLWPEMGYLVSAQNSMKAPFDVSLLLSVGQYKGHVTRINSVKLSVSRRRLKTGEPWRGSELRGIMRSLLQAWKPDEACVDCFAYQTTSPLDENGKPLMPTGGWLTYLTSKQCAQVRPPMGLSVEHLVDGGAIWTLCEEPFTTSNPEHMKLAAALDQALRPIQTYPAIKDRSLWAV